MVKYRRRERFVLNVILIDDKCIDESQTFPTILSPSVDVERRGQRLERYCTYL